VDERTLWVALDDTLLARAGGKSITRTSVVKEYMPVIFANYDADIQAEYICLLDSLVLI